jgi:hypothetical protein
VDEFYFESGYVETNYFVYVANATAGFTPYIAEGYLPTDFFEDRGSFSAIFCDAEIVVGMLLEAQAYLSSLITLDVIAYKLTDTTAALNCEFTQTAIGTRGQDTDLFAFTDAAIAVEVSRIRDNNIATSAVFDVAVDFVVVRSADANVDALFSAIISGLRSRDVNLETQAAFSFDVQTDLFKDFNSGLSAEASVNVSVEVIKTVNATISSEATASIDGNRIRFGISDIVSEFALDATARQIRDAHLTGTDVANIICDAVKTAQASSSQQAQFTQTTAAGTKQNAGANLAVYASVFISRNVGPYGPQTITGTFTGTQLQNSGNRITDLTGLNSDNWYFETSILLSNTGNTQSHDGKKLFYIPLGTRNGVESFIRGTASYRSNTGYNLLITFLLGGNRGNGTTMNSPTFGLYNTGIASFGTNNLFAVSFTGGQKLALYVNDVRVAMLNDYGTSDWTIPKNQTVQFAPDYPFTVNSQVHSAFTDYAYLTKGNFTDGGATTYTRPDPRVYSADTIFLYEFNGNGQENTAITQTANSVIQSQSSVSAAIGYVATYRATISASSSVTAVIGKLEEINIVAFEDAELSADVNVIRSANSEINAEASVSITAQRSRDVASAQSSEFTQTTQSTRVRFNIIDTTAEFNQTTSAVKTASVASSLSAQCSLTAVIGTLEDINLVAFSDAAVTTSAVKTTDTGSAVSGEFIQQSAVNVIASFEGAIQSENNLTVINSRLRDVSISLSTEATTLTVANEFEGATADFSSRFFTAHIYIDDEYLETGYYDEFETNVSKIAAGVANFAVTSTLSVSIRTDVFVAMVVNSLAAVVANVVKTTDVTVLEVSESTLTAAVRKITDITSTSTAVFTVFCNAVTAGEINLVAFSNASLLAIANVNKPLNAVLSSQATVFAYTQDSLNSVGEADISSEFSTNIVAVKQVSALIVTEAVASSLSVVVKSVAVEIPLDCNFTQTVQAGRIRPGISNQFAVATTLSEAVKTVDAQSAITAQSTVDATAIKIVSAVINIQSAGSTLTAVVKIAGLFIDCTVVSTVSASGVAINSAGATILSAATFISAPAKLVSVSAAIVSTGSVSATVSVRKQLSAAFTSALTFVVAIRDLRLDEIVYVIPGENYVYEIISESRLHDINGETRIRSVTGESRIRRITGESRIHIID